MLDVEVLSPVGDLTNFYVAISAGADAVYLGLNKFNARMKADNISLDNLSEVVSYAHLKGVKVYVTLNTLVSTGEMSEILSLVDECISVGVDALIVQDYGIIGVLKEVYPNIVLHGSTQLGVHNVRGARVAKKLGLSRVVLSREVTLEDIREISENVDIELEVFVQGAMCVCFSGNCYFSSLKYNASGNRGECKQICRLPYLLASNKDSITGYTLSPRDNCMLSRLEELIELGVVSFKIEGRLRRKGYVNIATRIYREMIDKISTKFDAKNTQKSDTNFAGKLSENLEQNNTKNYSENNNEISRIIDTEFTENNTPKNTIDLDKKDTRNLIKIKEENAEIIKMKNDLRKVFSRGEFIEGYFDGNNIIDTRSNNHMGEKIGKVISCTKFKDIFRITLDINCKLNPNDGLKFVSGNDIMTLGVGNIEVVDNKSVIFSKNYINSNSVVYRVTDEEFENNVIDKSKYRVLKVNIIAFENSPIKVTMTSGKYKSSVEGNICQTANNKPTTEEVLKEQISKIDNMKAFFQIASINVKMDSNIFVPVSEINRLRRECLETLKNAILSDQKLDIKKQDLTTKKYTKNSSKNRIAIVDEKCNINSLNNTYESLIISPTIYSLEVLKTFNEKYKKIFSNSLILNLPIIAMKDELKVIDSLVEYCKEEKIIFLANNIYALDYIKDGLEVWAGSNMNITNEYACTTLDRLGVNEMVGSIENWTSKIKGLYRMCGGNRVLMTFAHCPHKTLTGLDCNVGKCGYSGNLSLKSNGQTYNIRRYRIHNCYFELVDSVSEVRDAEYRIDDLRRQANV